MTIKLKTSDEDLGYFLEKIGRCRSKYIQNINLEKSLVFAAMRSILVSFEPKHEHKIAGAAYLMSEWFEVVDA